MNLSKIWPRLEGWQKNQIVAVAMGWTPVEEPPLWWKSPEDNLRRAHPLPFATDVLGIVSIARFCARREPPLHWTLSSGSYPVFLQLPGEPAIRYCAMVDGSLSAVADTPHEALAFAFCLSMNAQVPEEWL